MLPIITDATTIGDAGNAYSFVLSILVTVLILVLLMLREFLQAARKDSGRIRIDVLDIAIVPLLLIFGLLVILRVIDLVSLD